MDQQPLVSVIVPAYNASEFLQEAVQSILLQTYRRIECIIIDDCSADNTWEIITKLTSADSRVRAYKNDSNLGVGGTRSRGIELAQGDLICWQDADDISLPERIESQVAFLQDNPAVGIVGGWLEFFGEGMKTSVRKYAEDDATLRKSIFRYNPVAQPAAMVRRECYEKVGLYNESYIVDEDLEMLFRLGAEYSFGNVQAAVLRYRQSQNSLTRSKLKLMELTTIKLRREYAKHVAYQVSFSDYLYNFLQWLSIYLIPPNAKIALFNLLRNS